MSKQSSRDDQRINRLSSFLYWEGRIEARKIHPIKRNIYLIETNSGDKYVLKGHSNVINLKQQWEFFERVQSKEIVPFVRYPNGKKEISTGTNYYWTISPYVSGRKLNYQVESDRQKAVSTLKLFHATANQIYVKNMVRKQLFVKRWHARLMKFIETEQLFEKYRYLYLFQDITMSMKHYLEKVSNYPWNKEQLMAERNGTWVHGDVASHNFIHHDDTVIIDFDLLQCTFQDNDYIQLAQRFLPAINWEVDTLLSYNMVQEEAMERYLMTTFIPSDMLREWLHFLTRKRRISVEMYLQSMEQEWINRKEFLKESKRIIG
ncbi:phosphotransferase [Ornithinibacillus sp. FSL M8-0202]|uniref:phosphotransferase n=1 Tax=Ornithinibacillus sp. FSL M8-0202 TaxID=2921616 RepID=UPI0030CB6BA9